jgi:hypothetical protein
MPLGQLLRRVARPAWSLLTAGGYSILALMEQPGCMAAELAKIPAADLAGPWPTEQLRSGSGGHGVFSRFRTSSGIGIAIAVGS